MTTETITSKAELLAAIAQNWAALTAALDQLGEAQLTTVNDAQGWTIKDHLIHLYFCTTQPAPEKVCPRASC
jgi:hypothetical protein